MTRAEMLERIAELTAECDAALNASLKAQKQAAQWRLRAERLEADHMEAARARDGVSFLAQRVAYHLAHGCDTAERARELALSEWDVGVMGVRK